MSAKPLAIGPMEPSRFLEILREFGHDDVADEFMVSKHVTERAHGFEVLEHFYAVDDCERCADCGKPEPFFDALDRFGRCESCADTAGINRDNELMRQGR